MFSHSVKPALLLLAFTNFAAWLTAAEIKQGVDAGQLYRVTRLSVEQGLPQSSIKALVQTRDGYLWIGTLYGLARFDGMRYKVFDRGNPPEMTHDSINDLVEDTQDGSLWIGTGGELLHYVDHKFVRYGSDHGIAAGVGVLAASRLGGVWFCPRSGQVSLIRDGHIRTWEIDSKSKEDPRQITEEDDSHLLIFANYGILRLDLRTGLAARVEVPGKIPSCDRYLLNSDKTLWVCNTEGLWRGAGTNWIRTAWPATNIIGIGYYQKASEPLWITIKDFQRSSLYRLIDGTITAFKPDGLPAEIDVSCLVEDREGNLWIGTTTGLFLLQPRRLTVYSRRDGLQNDNVNSVTAARDGTVWLGTADGVSAIRKGRLHSIPPPQQNVFPGYGKSEVLLADSRDRLWIGANFANSGLSLLDGDRWQKTGLPWNYMSRNIKSAYEDRAGRIWLGARDMVFCGEGGQWSAYSATNGFSPGDVRVIHQDRRGDMWFGTYGQGLTHLREGKMTSYATPLGNDNNRAWWIHEDTNGVFWVASQKGLNRFVPPGVEDAIRQSPKPKVQESKVKNYQSQLTSADMKLDEDRFFTFTTQHGLPENVVNNIQEDKFGYLWLSGLRGVYRISRHELNEVAAGRAARADCIAYGEADGMLNSECNGGDNQPAGCTDNDGRIWFPTMQGVVVIDPEVIHRNEVRPQAVIEQVLADDESVFGDGVAAGVKARAGVRVSSPSNKPDRGVTGAATIRITSGHARVLEIRYTANSLVAPERVVFKFKLDGYDKDWRRDERNKRTAFYNNLWPGHYTFQVIARNNHGFWSDQPAKLSFYVAPHFWQTWLFYGFCGAAVVGLAAAVQAYRLRWQRRLLKLEQQQALANERTRIARDLHDDLGTALTGHALELDVIGQETGNAPESAQRLGKAAKRTRDLAERMREVVWAVNPQCDTVSSLASFLEQQVSQFLRHDSFRVRLEFPEDIPALPLDSRVRHQLALSVREALTNVVRHAHATEVVVSLAIETNTLVVLVADNGRGFRPAEVRDHGQGLASLRARLENIGGQFECVSSPGAGSTVTLVVPLGADTSEENFP